MAFGRPVVATAAGGIPEAVEDGVTGRIVPPREPAALAEALEREFLEETQLSVKTGDLLFVNDFIRKKPDSKRHVINLQLEVRARDLSPLAVVPHKALADLRFFDASELEDLRIRPDIGDLLIGLLRGEKPPRVYLGPL